MSIRNVLHIACDYKALKNFTDDIIADYDQVWRPKLENICGVMYLTLLYFCDTLTLAKIYMTIFDEENKLFIRDAKIHKGLQMSHIISCWSLGTMIAYASMKINIQ